MFVLSSKFIIVYTVNISGSDRLQYISVSINAPAISTTPVNISSNYISSTGGSFDGVVANDTLYLAWNGADVAVHATHLSSTLVLSGTQNYPGYVATLMSVTADTTSNSPTIWISFYDSVGNVGYSLATSVSGGLVTSPAFLPIPPNVKNLTGSAVDGILSLFWEVENSYDYDAAIKTNSIQSTTVDQDGGATTPVVVVARSVGLASKSFMNQGITYFLTAYASDYQPTYFLMSSDGNVVSKLAYSNGGGYVRTGLPNVTVIDNVASVAYLYRDLVQGVNKSQGVANTAGVYYQTGVNQASFNLAPMVLATAEIGQDLQLSGGFLWMYDGVAPVEHGFHLWPDYVEASLSTAGGVMTAQQYYYQAVYEWTDARGNIFRSAPSLPVSALVVNGAVKSFVPADVNTTSERITVPNHGYSTGTAFTFTTTGTLPSPFLVDTTYYAIVVDANTLKVAANYADALAGTAIDITTTGTVGSSFNPAAGQSSVTVHVPTMRRHKTLPNQNCYLHVGRPQQIYYRSLQSLRLR